MCVRSREMLLGCRIVIKTVKMNPELKYRNCTVEAQEDTYCFHELSFLRTFSARNNRDLSHVCCCMDICS